MMDPAPFVSIKKCAELYGITEKAPNGRIFIKIHAVNAWIQGKEA